MKQHYENETAVFEISNGVFHVTIRPESFLNHHAAQLVTNIRLGMQHDRMLPVLYNIDGFTDSDKPGRDFLARHVSLLATAVALCATTNVPHVIAAFTVSMLKPKIPCGVFTDQNAALNFLRNTNNTTPECHLRQTKKD